MNEFYSDNVNQQILIALLKANNIRYVVASPGGTNPALLVSFQYDGFFQMFSCIDERSAAYMACGIALKTKEPVVVCCTGATASRNYFPALTEAFYRKLPIIAITCSRPSYNIGQLFPQVTDRNSYNRDTVVDGELIQVVQSSDDFHNCEIKINRAIINSMRNGGGPVHLNVECTCQTCNTKELPKVNVINRIAYYDAFPKLPNGRIAIVIGSHQDMSDELQQAIEKFCEKHNAVILCDHTSGYYGDYRIQYALIGSQVERRIPLNHFELIIHIGEVSGDYPTIESIDANYVWRVNEDGQIRVRFKTLQYLFDFKEITFFEHYQNESCCENSLYKEYRNKYNQLISNIPDFPLCHISAAKTLSKMIKSGSIIHFAILNALRSWNFFEIGKSIKTSCNVGGFGIDGCTSTLLGTSFVASDTICYLITGDLAFFYDLNSLGNRHIKNNVRILLVNDGKGAEFRHFQWPNYGQDLDEYVAGAGHFGNKSSLLVKDYATALGFEYHSASTIEEFNKEAVYFTQSQMIDKPIILELFTSTKDQSDSWKFICHLEKQTTEDKVKQQFKRIVNLKKRF